MTASQNASDDDRHSDAPRRPQVADVLESLGRRAVSPFYNAGEHRLRAGWRILAHALLLGLVGVPAFIGLQALRSRMQWLAPDAQPGLASSLRAAIPLNALINALLGALVITLTVWAARRLLDRRSFASLGLAVERHTARDLVLGFVVAGAMQAVIFTSMWLLGWLRITGFGWHTRPAAELLAGSGAFAAFFLVVAWYEELLSRGYWLQNMSEGLNRPLAVLLSSSVFALAHVGNPNVSWVAIVGIVGAGLLLAWAYLCTGRLWLAVGLHFGWNLFEGPVFGFPVSGLELVPLIQIGVSGPTLWTGGSFGPEAGLLEIPVLVGGALALSLVRHRD